MKYNGRIKNYSLFFAFFIDVLLVNRLTIVIISLEIGGRKFICKLEKKPENQNENKILLLYFMDCSCVEAFFIKYLQENFAF